MILTIGQTAKAVGLSKTTICKHIENGKISAGWNHDTNPPQREIDASEILRVYEIDVTLPPSRRPNPDTKKPIVDTPLEMVVKAKDETIAALKAEIDRMADQLEAKDEQIAIANRLLAAPKPDHYAELLQKLDTLQNEFAALETATHAAPVQLPSLQLPSIPAPNQGILQRIASVFTGQKARAA